MFLAEQIRQQQLAAALESRLDSQSFSAMQAALLMNKLKAMGSTAAAAASAASMATSDTNSNSASHKKHNGVDLLTRSFMPNSHATLWHNMDSQ